MRVRILVVVLFSAVLTLAQTAAPANPAPKSDTPMADTTKSQPAACQKMMEGKATDGCCCMHRDTATQGDKKTMPCCQGTDGKEGMCCMNGDKDKMPCCQATDGKTGMACMKADKDKAGKMPCADGKCCQGTDMKDCCATKGKEQAAMSCCGEAMEHCGMMAHHDHANMN